jgi:quercetin dioxygenase-like cupin family protein
MKNILFGVGAVVFGVILSGCVNSGPAPQDVTLQNIDGRAVIIKDIYELPLIENKKLKETEIVKVFFPKADNVKMKCSMTLVKIPSGIQPPKYKQTSSQIIYAISGGGKLQIGNNIIILKKGVMVYVPPNATMAITNSVSGVLELVVVTSPPFETSQMTVIGDKSVKVKVAKDLENDMNGDEEEYQTISEKYKTKTKRKRKRILSIEEYRTGMGKDLLPDSKERDPIADLLNETKKTEIKPEKGMKWDLKMPDSSKVPLKKLEQEQREQLIPKAPQKAERTSLKNIQELTPQEQGIPIKGENGEKIIPAINKKELLRKEQDALDKILKNQAPPVKEGSNDQDSLEKLLNDQKIQQEKLIPKKTLKSKKTSLKHVQELTPEENVPTKSDTKTKL